LHHVLLDRWSQGQSPLHARDPRAKIVVLLVFLVVLTTTPVQEVVTIVTYAAVLAAGILIAGLPLGRVLLRSMAVLPFSLTFGLISWLAGEPLRAAGLIEKSYLSTVAVLLLVGTTPLPQLLKGLEALGAPRLLVLTAQFVYRYLFVISGQAQHLRLAVACRQGSPARHRRPRFRAAAGALAALFAASYHRAEGIHRAMLARGFAREFPVLRSLRFRFADGLFLLVIPVFLVLVRVP
jgi:cobalt/nickel transport system permease protein